MIKTIQGLVLLFISSLSWGQISYYYPQKDSAWETRSPSDFNINKELFEKAIEFAKTCSNNDTKDLRQAILKGFKREPYHDIIGPTRTRGESSGIIVKEGYIISKWGEPKRVDMTFSVTKSYLSMVAGLAYDRKLIKSTDDLVSNYVWNGKFDGEHNSKITWEHLLNQSSDWSGELWGINDWQDRPPKEGGIDDWKHRKLIEPGTTFEYNDVRVNILAYSLLEVWRKPLPKVLKEEIMDPIGASTTWRWFGYNNSWVNIDGIKMQSVSGGGHHGGGLFINSYDHARFGLLMLSRGSWDGKKVISKEWIKKATTPSPSSERYGYMWWLIDEGKDTALSRSAYFASGFGGNFIIIEPEHDLVIVLRWFDLKKGKEFFKILIDSMDK